MINKINMSNTTSWNHHRSGWSYCMNSLNSLHNPYGILLIDYLEKIIKEETIIKNYWIGFVHNVINNPEIISTYYGEKNNIDLEKIINSLTWKKNFSKCKGIFCLSKKNTDFMNNYVKSNLIYHATDYNVKKFNLDKFHNNKNKKLVLIGHWMRNFEIFFNLKSKLKKYILKVPTSVFNYSKIKNTNNSVSYIDNLSNFDYDELLSENIVFISLYDGSANNIIVECMARNTPVVINKTESTIEYLGKDYPLLYDSIEQAEFLINNFENIQKAHVYLNELSVKYNNDYFLNSFYNSEIYQSLPLIKLI